MPSTRKRLRLVSTLEVETMNRFQRALGLQWGVFDTHRLPDSHFLRYTSATYNPKDDIGGWTLIKSFDSQGPATRLRNELNAREEKHEPE